MCAGNKVECMSADPLMFACACMCMCVRVYGQGFYFGQAPVNDIKSVGVTVAKTEEREREETVSS